MLPRADRHRMIILKAGLSLRTITHETDEPTYQKGGWSFVASLALRNCPVYSFPKLSEATAHRMGS